MNDHPLISLYSGIGGLDFGFALAGFNPVYANDVDPLAPATYAKVMSKLPIASNRVNAAHKYELGDVSAKFKFLPEKKESVLIGGPPCQGFSRAGRMDPEDPRSEHVKNFITAVGSIRPKAFVMENVRALAMNPKWRGILDEVRNRAEGYGYAVEIILLNAKDYGVPQSRERMFMIGIRNDITIRGDLRTPTRSHNPVSVRTALSELVPFESQHAWQMCTAAITPAKVPVVRASPFAGMLFNGQGRPLDLNAFAPTISASLGGNHTPIVDQNWLDNPSENGKATIAYHRELVAGLRPEVPTTWRRLTMIEAARLQSFPSDLDWSAPRSAGFRQIGNAVPPLLALEVARRLARSIGINPIELQQPIPGLHAPTSVVLQNEVAA